VRLFGLEIDVEGRTFRRQRHLVAQQRLHARKRRQRRAGAAAHRHDAILIGAAAFCKQVLPPELLHRGLLGGQFEALVLVCEARQRRENGLFVVRIDIDLVNRKTQAAVEVPIERPGDDGNIIVGKGDRGHRHRPPLRELGYLRVVSAQ
jgi:hypothetical protein